MKNTLLLLLLSLSAIAQQKGDSIYFLPNKPVHGVKINYQRDDKWRWVMLSYLNSGGLLGKTFEIQKCGKYFASINAWDVSYNEHNSPMRFIVDIDQLQQDSAIIINPKK